MVEKSQNAHCLAWGPLSLPVLDHRLRFRRCVGSRLSLLFLAKYMRHWRCRYGPCSFFWVVEWTKTLIASACTHLANLVNSMVAQFLFNFCKVVPLCLFRRKIPQWPICVQSSFCPAAVCSCERPCFTDGSSCLWDTRWADWPELKSMPDLGHGWISGTVQRIFAQRFPRSSVSFDDLARQPDPHLWVPPAGHTAGGWPGGADARKVVVYWEATRDPSLNDCALIWEMSVHQVSALFFSSH